MHYNIICINVYMVFNYKEGWMFITRTNLENKSHAFNQFLMLYGRTYNITYLKHFYIMGGGD